MLMGRTGRATAERVRELAEAQARDHRRVPRPSWRTMWESMKKWVKLWMMV